MKDNPIFITGVYRSGTTILTGLIGAHRDIDIGHPTIQYFRYILKKNIQPTNYKEIIQSIDERINFRYEIKLDTKRIIDEIESEIKNSKEVSHKIIYDCVTRGLHGYSGNRWSEKILLEWKNIPTFLEMYPKGKAIHIIRDPRDVLASYKNMTYETEEKYLDAIFNCLDSMQHAIKYTEEISPQSYLLVKFEDLVADRAFEMKKICKFLDIEFNDSDYAEENLKEGAGEGTVELTIKTHSAFPSNSDEKSFKRWDSKLSIEELTLAEAILHDVINHFHYELSNNFQENYLRWLLDIFNSNELIQERFINYLKTCRGVESFPSDPTDPKNWSSSTLGQGKELGKGAANAYKKLFN